MSIPPGKQGAGPSLAQGLHLLAKEMFTNKDMVVKMNQF